jgi:hypothetical protein
MFIWGELLLLLFFVICVQINLFICDHEPTCSTANFVILVDDELHDYFQR